MHPKSGGRPLNVQTQMNHKRCPSRVISGPILLSTFIKDTLWFSAASASVQLSGTAEWWSWYTWEEGCHPEGCCQAWQIGPWKLLEIQQGQVKSLATGSGHSLISARAKEWMDWEQPCEEGCRNSGEQEIGCEQAMCTYRPEGQLHPELHQKQCDQQGEAGNYSLLVCSRKTPTGMQHSGQEAPAQEQHRPLRAGPGRGHKTLFL